MPPTPLPTSTSEPVPTATQIVDPPIDWKFSTPEEQGLDPAVFSKYIARIRSGDYGSIHSLLVLRHDHLVIEEYWGGYNALTQHAVQSISKSVVSALIGIAIAQGKIGTANDKVISFFPEYATIANMDANKQAIILSDLLTMRAGLEWDESGPSGSTKNDYWNMSNTSDWTKFVLDRPMVSQPGTQFVYSGGNSILLAGIIRNTTGMQARVFAQRNLFEPMGITGFAWNPGAQGITDTATGLYLRPRDMVKIGQLYLNKGNWKNNQILREDWVRVSTENHVVLGKLRGYGYQWWLEPLSQSQPLELQVAWGAGGQFIFVIPSLDMVVVSTAGDYAKGTRTGAILFIQELLAEAVKK